ncbi:unnamed protein product [Rhizophagus irregularis]|nr:unnamed protein product [Rhizophagus irregularis]
MEIARKSRSFTININENNSINNNSSVPLKVLKIGQLKYLIWHQKKVTLQLDDYDLMKLWMIDISEFKSDTIEEQIKKEEVEELDPFNYLSNYFSDQAAANKSIIIVQVPAITGEALKNVCKTYDWLKSLCRSSNKIATHKGSKGRNGICKRFEKHNVNYHLATNCRAEFSAANDKLDVNTAEDFELRTIKGIGNETAREIISKRPYVDEEDLYSQVKQNRWSR